MSDEAHLNILSKKNSSPMFYAVRTLYNSVIQHNYKVVLELGVCHGVSTRALLLGVKRTGGHLWSVDINECEVAAKNVSAWKLTEYWTFTQMDDRQFVESWKRSVGLLFIDTSHHYPHTLFELEAYSKFVKKNGVIYLHDTISRKEGVMHAILDFMKKHRDWTFREEGIIHGLGAMRQK